MEQEFDKRNPYKVPDNYFEDFSAKMQQRMKEITPEPAPLPESNTRKLWSTLRPMMYVAAMICVIYVCTYLVVQPRIEQEAQQLAQAEEQEAELLACSLEDEEYFDLEDEEFLDDLYSEFYFADEEL